MRVVITRVLYCTVDSDSESNAGSSIVLEYAHACTSLSPNYFLRELPVRSVDASELAESACESIA